MKTNVTVPSTKRHCDIESVAFFGSADIDEQHPLFQEVFIVARHVAMNGLVVVDGGGPGVMLAATSGARAGGGKVVTVTFEPRDMPEFEGKEVGNRADLEIKTANYIERMFGLIDQADAFICFQGGTGTLSEWSTAWLLAHLYYGNHKPLILYGAFWRDLLSVVNDHFFIGDKENQVYRIVETPEQLFATLNTFEQELSSRCGLPRKKKG